MPGRFLEEARAEDTAAKMCLEFKMGIVAKGNVMQASERLHRRISRGFPEKALLCLTMDWESLTKAPDKVPTLQPRNVGGCVKNPMFLLLENSGCCP